MQELNQYDPDRRLLFLKMVNLISTAQNDLYRIYLSDESSFLTMWLKDTIIYTGVIKRPHGIEETRTQNAHKSNAWTAITENRITGPFLIDEAFDGPLNLNLKYDPVFHQDRAHLHFYLPVR